MSNTPLLTPEAKALKAPIGSTSACFSRFSIDAVLTSGFSGRTGAATAKSSSVAAPFSIKVAFNSA